MDANVNLNSIRAKKAHLQKSISDTGHLLLVVLFIAFGSVGVYCLVSHHLTRVGYFSLAVASISLMLALWYSYDLKIIPPKAPAKSIDDFIAPSLLYQLKDPLSPRTVWEAAMKDSAGRFMCNRLYINPKDIDSLLTDSAADLNIVWRQAILLAQSTNSTELHAGTVAAAMMLTSEPVMIYVTQMQIKKEDIVEVYNWLDRQLRYMNRPKAYFGGVGRDWASGFTPNLEKVGTNISESIEVWGGYGRFAAHADVMPGLGNNLSQGTAVALVGPAGVGKTELVFAFADRLLAGQVPGLRYYQIISLDASSILSSNDANNMENLMTYLFAEAIAANNIILYLDEAQLFFSEGVGSFDISKLLLPVLKNRRLKIIASFTPNDWQHLRSTNESLAASFSPIIIHEPAPADTLKVIEDSALLIELHARNIMITYGAISEAYRLSGQYMQDEAYPGKAITLLEQAMPYVEDNIMLPKTVQFSLEKMRGVRVSSAEQPEADMLLHLEDRIHQRMINQKLAVDEVAAALRRSRAGVSSTKRPVGSFLFLGPTGVGKTELARSLAAVYFGDEHQMIRLDMSEYQSPEDVSRLLESSKDVSHINFMTEIREKPFSVVLLDEVEKAHSNILNLLLQMLDEGQITDQQGRAASFRNSIIIATSNAGANDIINQVRAQQPLDDKFERVLLNQLIDKGTFRPELINRFDAVVLFRPLKQDELTQVGQLMLNEINATLANQNVKVNLTEAAMAQVVAAGYDPEFGARPMRRVMQKAVEDAVAIKILNKEVSAGSVLTLDVGDLKPISNNNQNS